MTAELEYSFIDVVADLRIAQELMTRAVRVKQAVRDKLIRVYSKNLVAPVVNNVETQEVENKEVNSEITVEPEVKVEKPSLDELVDLSEGNLSLLNGKLDALVVQNKVPTTYRRAVLFTNNLISKIKNVNSKWFVNTVAPVSPVVEPTMDVFSPVGVMPTVETTATPSAELPKVEFTNHLGGEVIPGTWDDMPEKTEVAPIEPTVLPNVEPISPVAEPAVIPSEPTPVELTPIPEPVVATLPSIEEQPSVVPELNSVPEPEVQNIVPEPTSVPEIPATPVEAEPEQNENAIPEIKLPDLDTKMKRETPNFMPKVITKAKKEESEEVTQNIEPLPELTQVPEVPTEEVKVEKQSVEEPKAEEPAPVEEQPVEEPKAEEPAPAEEQPVEEPAEIPVSEFVPEPAVITGLPVEESKVEEQVEEPEAENAEVKAEEEPTMSIEDRIAELLNRKKEEQPEEPENEESAPVEEQPAEEPKVEEPVPEEEPDEEVPEEEPPVEEKEEKPEITQATIMAKLQRFNNIMKEKDSELKSLREKNQKLADDNASIKDKMNDFDTVVKDLTNKNNDLVAENEKLTNKNEKIEGKYKDKVENLENQVEELTKAKKEESESSKNAINEIKERYEKEIEELKKKHAEELKKANDSNERKIQAIYNTISETLGDSYTEDQEKSL